MSAISQPAEPISIQALKGVGPRLLQRLEKLGIRTLEDLLFHLPLRYQDRTRMVPIGSLQPGDEATIQAEVVLSETVHRGKRSLLILLQDGTGSLTLRFFHFSAVQREVLGQRGADLRCYGEVRSGPAMLEMIHPECQRLDGNHPAPLDDHLTPVYPTTEGLRQFTLRRLAEQALQRLETETDAAGTLLPELLPPNLLTRLGMPPLVEALRLIHRPPPTLPPLALGNDRHPARRRLAFEELLAHHLSLRQLRRQIQRNTAPPLASPGCLTQHFMQALPFPLTQAQHRVIRDITADLALPRPMLRLVQGDVGSGKTVVAAAAALRAIEAGFQAAIMAPTELLAEQHYRNFQEWLTPHGIAVAWLTGKLKGKTREAMLSAIRSGVAQLIVGTHALFQEEVVFANLALVIIDEQHRFGVHQRLALREKGREGARCPHQLIMTATPIPRTLAMSAYADLDTSVIDELPPGRIPVQTVVIPRQRRAAIIARIRCACRSGQQVYWVCPLIEESETLQCQAAVDTAAELAEALPERHIGLVHGRMKATEKGQMMRAFKAGELDLLVATTVVEVGVDVPNASLMIIENAERLGLAQLHQLRGRVGRSNVQSSCVLLYHGPLSQQARARLAVLRTSHDGFEIAHRDLELRGPGEVLGTRQTGILQLRIADLIRDEDLLNDVRQAADELLADYPASAAALTRRWLGETERYGEV